MNPSRPALIAALAVLAASSQAFDGRKETQKTGVVGDILEGAKRLGSRINQTVNPWAASAQEGEPWLAEMGCYRSLAAVRVVHNPLSDPNLWLVAGRKAGQPGFFLFSEAGGAFTPVHEGGGLYQADGSAGKTYIFRFSGNAELLPGAPAEAKVTPASASFLRDEESKTALAIELSRAIDRVQGKSQERPGEPVPDYDAAVSVCRNVSDPLVRFSFRPR